MVKVATTTEKVAKPKEGAAPEGNKTSHANEEAAKPKEEAAPEG